MTFVFDEDGHAPFLDIWERAGDEWAHMQDIARRRLSTDSRSSRSQGDDYDGEDDTNGDGGDTCCRAPILVVAHGAFNRALLLQMLGLPMAPWRDDKDRFVFDNCECMELEVNLDLHGESLVESPGGQFKAGSESEREAGSGGSADDAPEPGTGVFARRWRRRYPKESLWTTRRDEVERL